MPAPFVHLHTHSNFSFLRALASPAELAQAAADHEMPALALTDHLWLTGAVEFYQACLHRGVRPVLGLELPVALPQDLPAAPGPQGTLLLLARDLSGWRSLCRLSSAALSSGVDPSPLPFETLAQEAHGLLCLSGGHSGLLPQLLVNGQERAARELLARLREVFERRLYVELFFSGDHAEELCERLYRLSRKQALPAAAAHPVHYLQPQQEPLARLAAAVRLNLPLASLAAAAAPPPGAHFLSPGQMAERFAAYPDALDTTLDIAAHCRLELPLGQPHYPHFPLAAGETAASVLRRKAEQGALRLYGDLDGAMRQRLDHELDVIDRLGYADLFLVMEEILQFARRSAIPHASRGSASSSLVAHCLGITTPDPVRLNLYFERFLNPARQTPPDIDTDLCSRRRDEVIRFVYKRWGAERVAMVCTVSRFRRRSALREAAKVHGLPPARVSTLAEAVPWRGWGPPERSAPPEHPYASLLQRWPEHRPLFEDAAALIGLPRHLSIHPGGVVIAPMPVTDLVPTQFASKGILITQFDLDAVEHLGLLKIDLLGIRGLTVLGDLARALHQHAPNSSSPAPLDLLEAIPLDDPLTADAVRSGRTIGCFQVESPGMRLTLRQIQAASPDDIMAALALYRPGPLTGGLKDAFVRRFRGEEEIVHLHPALAPLLDDTCGVILYQEQVLRIAHELAGLSLADADLLRRAMSHFDPGKQMVTLQEKFIAGAASHSGLPAELAGRIWEMMAAFAGYGFPKAHAASYAVVAWRAAWCKTHHPALFMAAVLANWGGYYGQQVYIMEARRLGLTLRPSHVSYARREFSVQYPPQAEGRPVLFMGLDQVRDLTRRTQARILKEQPFHSLEDFLTRVDPRPAEAENLARSGALEGFGAVPAVLRRLQRGGWRGGQLSLFPLDGSAALPGADDWTPARKAAAQREVLGVSVDHHPLELAAAQIGPALSTIEAAGQVGQRVRTAGMRQTWRRFRTRQGETFYTMSLEDLEGMLSVWIPAEVHRRLRGGLSGLGPYIIEGVVEYDHASAEPVLHAERIERVMLPEE